MGQQLVVGMRVRHRQLELGPRGPGTQTASESASSWMTTQLEGERLERRHTGEVDEGIRGPGTPGHRVPRSFDLRKLDGSWWDMRRIGVWLLESASATRV